MKFLQTIEKVIARKVLITQLTLVPEKGAAPDEIKCEESLIGKKFSIYHKAFLERWNGINLDVIRIYGCGDAANNLKKIAKEQFDELISKGFIAFGSDPSGFVYLENEKAEIFSFDTDGGEIEFLAENLDVFFTTLVFGQESNKFLGDEWKQDLIARGIVEASSSA